MSSNQIRSIPEKEVVRIWQRQLQKQRHLADCEGKPIEVIYPGRPNDGRGGDFRDAVVNSGSQYQYGCIEVHTRTSGWQAHGHHLDPIYNQVVLHVALEKDRQGETCRQNGLPIPTVILDKNILRQRGKGKSKDALPCQAVNRRRKPSDLENCLDRAGDSRLGAKATRYEVELSCTEADQSLYLGILEALGYSQNQAPFRELGCKLPLHLMEKIIGQRYAGDGYLVRLQALLLGKAGLLPSQRLLSESGGEYVSKLEGLWTGLSQTAALYRDNWELFKVRPGNYPVRRIIALSYLISRFRQKGCFQSLLDLVRKAALTRAQSEFESALLVKAEGYWAGQVDFGHSRLVSGQALLGRERAAEIIINVLLPFFLCWSRIRAETALERKIRDIYHSYPRTQTNSIERHMLHQLSLAPARVKTARRQQGLIHFYKTFCTQGKCTDCCLGHN